MDFVHRFLKVVTLQATITCVFFSGLFERYSQWCQLLTFVGYIDGTFDDISFGFTILYQLQSKAFFWSSNQKRDCFFRYIYVYIHWLTVISHFIICKQFNIFCLFFRSHKNIICKKKKKLSTCYDLGSFRYFIELQFILSCVSLSQS